MNDLKKCPACGSEQVQLVGRQAWQCRDCQQRWYAAGSELPCPHCGLLSWVGQPIVEGVMVCDSCHQPFRAAGFPPTALPLAATTPPARLIERGADLHLVTGPGQTLLAIIRVKPRMNGRGSKHPQSAAIQFSTRDIFGRDVGDTSTTLSLAIRRLRELGADPALLVVQARAAGWEEGLLQTALSE